MAKGAPRNPDSLPSPIQTGEQLEPALRPLVDASHSALWRKALNVLFVSGPVLELVNEVPVPVLVGITGREEGVDHFLGLMKSRAASDLARIGGSLIERFLPSVVAVIQEAKPPGDQGEAALVAGVAARFIGERGSIEKWIYSQLGAAVQGAVSVADGIGALLLETLRDKRTEILTNILEPADHERMLDGLLKLRMIEPRIQASLCGKCGNYGVAISSAPQPTPLCPRCGFGWLTLTLFVFAQALVPLKAANKDLPLFISAYLRSKVARLMPIGEVEVLPLARFGTRDHPDAEVDVLVPALRLGVECKEFEDALAPMTRPRISSMTDDLEKQIRRYLRVGLTRISVVTNLPPKGATKLAHALGERFPALAARKGGIEVAPGTADALLTLLDSISEQLSKLLATALAQRFEKSAPRKALPRLPVLKRAQDVKSSTRE